MTTGLRIIDGDLVRRLLDMRSCIAAMRQAFVAVSEGAVDQPVRTAIAVPAPGWLGLMPCAMQDPPGLGIKIVSIFAGNFDRGLPTHQGVVILFDPEDGRPLAVLDAHALTAIRTAAASAVATDLLARPDATRLALLGYGDQARTHLEALSLVRPLSKVLVWGRNAARARAFADAAPCPVDLAASVEDAVAQADIICTLTHSPEPILFGRWLRPGQHINAVGASQPHTAELDGEAVRRSRCFTDYAASASVLAGELRSAGIDNLLGEIGAIQNGTLQGRRSSADITCFKSLGMAAEDLVAAQLVYARALQENLGQSVKF